MVPSCRPRFSSEDSKDQRHQMSCSRSHWKLSSSSCINSGHPAFEGGFCQCTCNRPPRPGKCRIHKVRRCGHMPECELTGCELPSSSPYRAGICCWHEGQIPVSYGAESTHLRRNRHFREKANSGLLKGVLLHSNYIAPEPLNFCRVFHQFMCSKSERLHILWGRYYHHSRSWATGDREEAAWQLGWR